MVKTKKFTIFQNQSKIYKNINLLTYESERSKPFVLVVFHKSYKIFPQIDERRVVVKI